MQASRSVQTSLGQTICLCCVRPARGRGGQNAADLRKPGHPLKHLTLILAILIVLGGGWFLWDRTGARDSVSSLPGVPSLSAAAPALQSVRKCIQGGQALYTDGDCPAGSRPQTMQTDRVTVLPAAPKPAAAAASAAGKKIPNVRDLLGTPEDGNLKSKQMDKVIGQ